jgi:hypothetical protein
MHQRSDPKVNTDAKRGTTRGALSDPENFENQVSQIH